MHNEQKVAPRRASAAGIVAPARKPAAPSAMVTALTTAPSRSSAAGLTVPKTKPAALPAPATCEPPLTGAEGRTLFDRLRALRDEIRPASNLNDLAIALIEACIGGGIRTKPDIVRALVHLHLSNRHAGKMVDVGAKAGRWRKGADGCYSYPLTRDRADTGHTSATIVSTT